jgi:predicted nucleotidyltransferase
MTCDELVSALRACLSDNLQSVVLYGSSAAGDFVPGFSGHDVLIVVQQLSAAELRAVRKALLDWERSGNPLPQIFTRQELLDSADVFPIEFLDMRQSRRVLYGADPLAELKIDMRHYRGQLERELKVRLELLRRRYIACGGDEERLAQLLAKSVSSFLILLRAVLRLYNENVPAEKADVLAPLAQHLAFDPRPLRDVLALRTRRTRPEPGELETLFGDYLHSIGQVVRAVDGYLHP